MQRTFSKPGDVTVQGLSSPQMSDDRCKHAVIISTAKRNVAIALHCNSRPHDVTRVILHLNYEAHAMFVVCRPIRS